MKDVDIAHALHRRLAYLEVRLERDCSASKASWLDLEAGAIQVALERLGLFSAERLARYRGRVREDVFPAIETRNAAVIPMRRAGT